ncbi:MAG: 1,6-anhydro-N-acetylmuramyl-L-alanine amidase AmpD [Gammaproteobacteria bacterium]|nr:1,6-anhydro-N-acetylmuramyl-L-alanine amidase AmpD [Gammaproteobacteria bacterium]
MEERPHIDGGQWLTGALVRPSPNCNDRPREDDIGLVVIHGITVPPGRFGTGLVEALFLNTLDLTLHAALADLEGVRVSAHLFIDRGGVATQFVPFHRRAWHAGVSSFGGRENCNDFAIGIELEGTDDSPYEHAQYERLTGVLQALFLRYPQLSPSRVVGHAEVAPGRKTDPGPAFDWQRLMAAIATSRLSGPTPG